MNFDFADFQKQKFTITNWEYEYNLRKTIHNVRAIKLSWAKYETATTGDDEMKIEIDGFNKGIDNDESGSQFPYFAIVPLVSTSASHIYYEGKDGFVDYKTIGSNVDTINQLFFRIYINGQPATDITSLNTLKIELLFFF